MTRSIVAMAVMYVAAGAVQAQTTPVQPPVLSTVPTPPAGAMPEPAAMSGLPLQVGDLPPGTIAVRVIRKSFSNNIAGLPVKLIAGSSGSAMSATSDQQGRAQFTGLSIGSSARATAVVDGEVLESQQFELPAQGGVRLVLVAGVGAGAVSSTRSGIPSVAMTSPTSGASSEIQKWPIATGLALLCVIGGGMWASGRRGSGVVPPAAPLERPRLFESLVQVEQAFRAGLLQTAAYQKRREDLIEQICRLDASRDAAQI